MCWEFVLFLASSSGPCISRNKLHLKLKTAGLIEEKLAVLWNLKLHYCAHRKLDQLNKFYTLVPYFFNIHFNTAFHLCLSLSRGLFP
jgi:hypothetical protein